MDRQLTRRTLLGTAAGGATLALAGCTGGESGPPAGSVKFRHDADLPHSLSIHVTDVGIGVGEGDAEVVGDPPVGEPQRTLSTALTLDPGDEVSYESVFTEPFWYRIALRVDGQQPVDEDPAIRFNPAPDGATDGRYLTLRFVGAEELDWSIASTENLWTVLD